MSNAISGIGTKFGRSPNGGTTYTPIAEVNSISGPSISRETIDVTSLDSTNGWREFIPSFRTGGTVNLNMNYTQETYRLLYDDFMNDTEQMYEVMFPDSFGSKFRFTGFVMELPVEVSVGDKITNTVSIQITGEPSYISRDEDNDGIEDSSSS